MTVPSTWTLPVIDLEALIHLWNFALQGHYLEFLSSALLCSSDFHLPMAAPPWPALTCCLSQAVHRAPGLRFPDTAPSPHNPALPTAPVPCAGLGTKMELWMRLLKEGTTAGLPQPEGHPTLTEASRLEQDPAALHKVTFPGAEKTAQPGSSSRNNDNSCYLGTLNNVRPRRGFHFLYLQDCSHSPRR